MEDLITRLSADAWHGSSVLIFLFRIAGRIVLGELLQPCASPSCLYYARRPHLLFFAASFRGGLNYSVPSVLIADRSRTK